jgi:DNA-binding transcriptional LysR family regulator
MNLRQLEIFTTIAESGSFTAASKKLHMAQPAVSIALKKLEEHLGIQLICRSDNALPTAEGTVLLLHAKRLLNQMQTTKQAMSDLNALDSGLVRFSTTPILGNYFFPDKVQAFNSLYPNIHFKITHQETIEEQRQLREQQCDMAIVNMESVPKDMEAIALNQQEIVACTAINHPLATQQSLLIQDFLKQPLALYQREHTLRKIIDNAASHLNITPCVVLESDLTEMILQAISHNMGIGLCLRNITRHEKNLAILPFDKPLFLKLGLGWKKEAYLSSANRAFIDFLQKNTEQ